MLLIGWKEVHFSCNMSAKLQHECKIQIVQARFKNLVYLDFLSCFFIFITFILKSLVILEIWLALIGAIFLPIAPFFALNCIFLPSQQKNFTKIQQPIACVKKLIKLQEMRKELCNFLPNQLTRGSTKHFYSKESCIWSNEFCSFKMDVITPCWAILVWNQITSVISDQIALHLPGSSITVINY